MNQKINIFHCSENASEVFLLNLEAYLDAKIVYQDEFQSTKEFVEIGPTIVVITDQFIKSKSCLQALMQIKDQFPNANLFSIIYHHSSLRRTDKAFFVKSQGNIDLYYYKNYWSRRIEEEHLFYKESGLDPDTEQLRIYNSILESLEQIGLFLSQKSYRTLEFLESESFKSLTAWVKKPKLIRNISSFFNDHDMLTRVPGLKLPENNPQIRETVQHKEKGVPSDLLKKLIAFKKEQLGDSEIADEFIERQLAETQAAMMKDEIELLSSLNKENNKEEESVIVDDEDESQKLSKKDIKELDDLLDHQMRHIEIKELRAKEKELSLSNVAAKEFVLITGATSGIGKATSRYLAKKGYNLVITGRRKDRLKKTKKALEKKYGITIHTLKFDVRDFKKTQKALKTILKKSIKISVLINNAGLASGLSTIQDGDVSDWNRMIDTNIKGLLHVTRCILPTMIERGNGHVVNIGSIAGKQVYPMGNVYNASKFAVEALTQAMRLDLNGTGIRVSQVSPGHVEDTEFARVRFHGDVNKAKIYDDFNPVTSKDIAKIIRFIIEQPKHVNVQDVLVMGTHQASANLISRNGRLYD